MALELCCDQCGDRFQASPETPAPLIQEAMASPCGHWFFLEDGATFEDMIHSTLLEQGAIRCSECGLPVSLCESSFLGGPDGHTHNDIPAGW